MHSSYVCLHCPRTSFTGCLPSRQPIRRDHLQKGAAVTWAPLIVQLGMSVNASEHFGRRVDAVFGALDNIAQGSVASGHDQSSGPSTQWSIARQQVYRYSKVTYKAQSNCNSRAESSSLDCGQPRCGASAEQEMRKQTAARKRMQRTVLISSQRAC